MPFVYNSCLPSPIRDQEKFDCLSGFDCDIDSIKNMLTEIANTYLQIAFRIYEINRYKSFKPRYKNIVDACQSELGFKKSTTYNMINIVKTFGTPDSSGFISYKSLFGVEKFSYSQLCEMLSLSDRQRSLVTPDMTVNDIRSLKKSDSITDHLIELDIEHNRKIFHLEERVKQLESELANYKRDNVCDNFQTSGKICFDSNSNPAYSFCCSFCNHIMDVDIYDCDENFITDIPIFCPYCGCNVEEKKLLL